MNLLPVQRARNKQLYWTRNKSKRNSDATPIRSVSQRTFFNRLSPLPYIFRNISKGLHHQIFQLQLILRMSIYLPSILLNAPNLYYRNTCKLHLIIGELCHMVATKTLNDSLNPACAPIYDIHVRIFGIIHTVWKYWLDIQISRFDIIDYAQRTRISISDHRSILKEIIPIS